MSEHHTSLVWSKDERPFTYEQYGRDHRVTYGTGTAQDVSAASEYRGNPALPNPEELLVAALSSCHMLTFLAIAAKKKLVVERYQDDAVGTLARPEGGPMQVTEVTLKPRVTFSGEPPDQATLASMHEQAHRGCFIANSVKTVVRIDAAI
jgi:organic hydroperoxide reductase OsmC/OhrA